MGKKEGRKILLSKSKIDKLFVLINEYEGDKFVANKLNVTYETLNNWKKVGKQLQESFEPILIESELYDFETDLYEEEFSLMKEEIESEFLEYYKFNTIDFKNKRTFDDFYEVKKEKYLEPIKYDFEYNVLKKINFVSDENKNNEIILYILFYRVYERARTVLATTRYLRPIQYHSKSAHCVDLAEKRLKKLAKEDFAEDPKEVSHKHSGKISIFDGMLEYFNTQQVEKKDSFLIEDKEMIQDVEYEFIEKDED